MPCKSINVRIFKGCETIGKKYSKALWTKGTQSLNCVLVVQNRLGDIICIGNWGSLFYFG